MSPLPPEILAELQQEYIQTFDEKKQSLEMALKSHNMKQLTEVIHKLAGSGTTYNMPEITRSARIVETYLLKTKKPDMRLLRQAIDLLKEIFDSRKLNKPVLDVTDHSILKQMSELSVA